MEERLATATLGGLREEGQELLQGWRSSKPQQPWAACGGAGAAPVVEELQPWAAYGRRCRRYSGGGGAANCSNLGQPAGGTEAAPGVGEQLTAAILGGLQEEGQELLQGWRSANRGSLGRPAGGEAGAAPGEEQSRDSREHKTPGSTRTPGEQDSRRARLRESKTPTEQCSTVTPWSTRVQGSKITVE